jgi:hypothetical protein
MKDTQMQEVEVSPTICLALHEFESMNLGFRLPLTPFQIKPIANSDFQARLAAKVALYHFCLWSNLQLDRAPLAFAELLEW